MSTAATSTPISAGTTKSATPARSSASSSTSRRSGTRPIALHTKAGRLGYIGLLACAALLGGSLPTIALARRTAARVPDRVHSVAYVALLVIVLLVMLVMGI